MAYPMYPQNYPQFPTYQPYQQPVMQTAPQPMSGSFQNGNNQQIPQPAPQMMTPPVQNSAPISVRSEQDARDWPIAPGNSLTFIDESAGYVYTKTSLNQFDRPQFVKYRLVREDVAEASTAPAVAPQAPAAPAPAYALQSDIDAISGAVELMKNELQDFRARLDDMAAKKPGTRKKEDSDNE